MIPAIILDYKASSFVLDADPTHGLLKEPILKLLGYMLSIKYIKTIYDRLIYPIFSLNLVDTIGQIVYDQSDVFSFFSADFYPSMKFFRCALISAEAELLSFKTNVEFSNGLSSLI